MLLRLRTALLCAALAFAPSASARPEPPDFVDDLDRLPAHQAHLYEVVKPTPAELKWQAIPWLTDLAEGLRQARAERRPLFLWVSGDDPLERC
jgi:hypothetical protein